MNMQDSFMNPIQTLNSIKINKKRQEFWNGTLVDNYNFLMSEELICRCKSSLEEPFSSLNDLAVHHVSYNEFEKQYIELSDWCAKISDLIKKISSNTLTCYLRQKHYEELYEQGLMRLRMFNQYSNKLIERFPDLNMVITNKMETIYRIWNELEARFIGYLDEDFDQIIHDLYDELHLFEEWIIQIEEQLERFDSIRNEKISSSNIQDLMKVQDEIKSKNSRVSSVIEICDRLKADYQQQIEQIPFDYASDLENRWHQIWINSVEIQCKLEERHKIVKHSTSFPLVDDNDDIIPFSPSEYEKLSRTSSNNTSIDYINSSLSNRKRTRSPDINTNIISISLNSNRKMIKSKRRRSLNYLPNLSPSKLYYSLTNINDYDDKIIRKKQKKTTSKLDIGYASEDDYDKKPLTTIKKCQSDNTIRIKSRPSIQSSLAQSLPLFKHFYLLPKWWRYSITSAYDTCSNPDVDISIEETKKKTMKPSLLMYSKKYTKIKKYIEQKSPLKSNSYDASTENTDPEQSENDVDVLSSDLVSLSSVNHHHNPHHQNSDSLLYNRYITTTTTGYSSDIELETRTIPSEIEDRPLPYTDDMTQMNTHVSTSLPTITSNEDDSSNAKINSESSEPCWDGYQNPLFYSLNPQDIDSMETTLKWDDQFFEIDQLCNTTSDDDMHIHDDFVRPSLRNNNSASLSLITRVTNKSQFDSDSDLDDFNYVINESERQLLKTQQSLEKKKRTQSLQESLLNERTQRKYDELIRTCETNIQCLEQILNNLHRSNNSRLNNTQAIELLQKYLSDWNDMKEQVNDDRIRTRQLLHISQDTIKLKSRIDNTLSLIHTSLNSAWFDFDSINKLKDQIFYEINLEKENRQKLITFYIDLDLIEQNIKSYHMAYSDVSTFYHIDQHLHNSRVTLEQFTNKLNTYRNQLRTLVNMIDNLLPIETHIEQKLTSVDHSFQLQELQSLIDDYERMIPMNDTYLIIKNHCEYKLELYKKMFHDIIRKHDKHVSFDRSININNNNSTNFNSSTSSSSTPQIHYTYSSNDNFREKNKTILNQYKETKTQDIHQNSATSKISADKHSSTSSYISDDCKVLYIETVIEVPKPVFYEQTTNRILAKDTEYYHRTHPQIVSKRNNYYMNKTNKNQLCEDSTDDELSTQNINPVNLTTAMNFGELNDDHLKQHGDSGIELDQTSSSSTIYNKKISNDHLLFPSTNRLYDKTSPSTLVHRLQKQSTTKMNDISLNETSSVRPLLSTIKTDTYWNRLKQKWFRSLLIGLFILFLLFLVYVFGLDNCSRTTLVQYVFQKIICIENEGLPTI